MPSSACKKCALDRKSTRLNSSHTIISYAVFCLKKTCRVLTPPPIKRFPILPNVHPYLIPGLFPRRKTLPFLSRRPYPACFFNDTATTEIYTLSLHDALPIYLHSFPTRRSSDLLQSHDNLV